MASEDNPAKTNRENFAKYEESSIAWQTFVSTLRSPETKQHYKYNLLRFCQIANIPDGAALDALMSADKQQIQRLIVQYLLHRQDKQGVRPQTVAVELSCIKHLFVYNDRTDLNWKIIKSHLKEAKKSIKDKAYTTEEIKSMLTYADLRAKCVMLLMASSGMRIGGIPTIRMKHMRPIDKYGIYAITVYADTPDEYTTYCSPECRTALDAYLQFRKIRGEELTADSPLIRERFDAGAPYDRIEGARAITRDTLVHLSLTCALKCGLRSITEGNRKDRKPNMLNHAFRKFFFKACKAAEIDPIVRELLMGHKVGNQNNGITKLMVIYDATEDGELLDAYLKVIEHVTITDEDRAKVALKKEELKNTVLNAEIDQFKSALVQLKEQGLISM